ncbi:amino acid ABC transporter substrate-binding protein [Pseudomonas daroniae]|uniref:Amino acid ABC transporter substrate-binding protein n=1 Tax=Phytopseudomonas daroniae TaxID=2487519 RepID=A0A4Q9QN07_9GAMM|nr:MULTISPECIES: FecR family protein [Pseudomonas]TBU81123.1 amino acid ABC transporter substrate-binding protein [Pseudomonas daroniae]TBU83648.1 amino acid ABC transporter substrate-binding protein [Pseudomonas sp. FRB 228]TBU89419.1 amino acid ABC transporter substrate-binding protein [Pseudomonas daroniae]
MIAASAPVSNRVLEAAIHWQLCLDSGMTSEREKVEFQRWLATDPEHARAWKQLTGLDQQLGVAATPAARKALLRRPERTSQRRNVGGLLGLLLVGALGLGLLNHQRPLSDWLADERTASGEQLELQLVDRSRVRLNSRSALDIDFNPKERRLFLRSGEILVETAHGDPRPFLVETRHGTLRPLGTRFLVREEDQGTRLIVLQSAVAAHPLQSPNERVIEQNQQVLMNSYSLGASQSAPPAADAWMHGMLVVENVRLADLLERLGEYQNGHLGVDDSIADLRISGSFPLRNRDLALAALPASLPVRVERYTDWWIRIVPQAEKP